MDDVDGPKYTILSEKHFYFYIRKTDFKTLYTNYSFAVRFSTTKKLGV